MGDYWRQSSRNDPRALPLADAHYSRQKPGTPGFVPPGRCMVLLAHTQRALWCTSWPYAKYTKHRWAGAWMNTFFRNEARDLHLSSELILEAVAITRWFRTVTKTWVCDGEPAHGMVTFVDAEKVRHKRDVGRCYRRAGFRHVGETVGGLLAFQMLCADMPPARAVTIDVSFT